MKKLLYLILALILVPGMGIGQDGGSDINEKYTKQSLFMFNTFTDGTAYFNDGGIAKAKYNYNVVNDEICYLKNSNILVISNIDELDSIKIGNRVFQFVDNKILEKINSEEISVFLRRKANIPSEKPSGAYGTQSNTSAVTKKTSIYSTKTVLAGEYVNIENDDDTEIPIDESYYLFISDNIVPASKFQITRFFKDHKKEVKNYIKENNINFQKKEDLLKLSLFLENYI